MGKKNKQHKEVDEQKLQEEIIPEKQEKSLEEQCEEYKAGWQRSQADYQNLKREVEGQRSQWVKMSELQIIEEFIPVYENFKKAFAGKPQIEENGWGNWAKGIEYIMKQFEDVFKAHSLEPIEVKPGDEFNHELHEAISEEESEEKEGTIIREVAGGYKLGDKVIQPAKVVVSK